MPESATHADLVQAIVAYAARTLGPLSAIAVREDAVRPLRGERPPRIGGYTPDVHATDVPTTTTLIGEAKTKQDLETEHSRRQISAFLKYLAVTPHGIFVLAVPLAAGASARRLLAELQAPFSGSSTSIIVLDGSEGWQHGDDPC
jgi:hypothetical protein